MRLYSTEELEKCSKKSISSQRKLLDSIKDNSLGEEKKKKIETENEADDSKPYLEGIKQELLDYLKLKCTQLK